MVVVEVMGACLALDIEEWKEGEALVPPVTPKTWVRCADKTQFSEVVGVNQPAHSKCRVHVSRKLEHSDCWNAWAAASCLSERALPLESSAATWVLRGGKLL